MGIICPPVGIGLTVLSKSSGAVAPLPLRCLRPCVDLRLKCVHDIRWLNGWVDEVLFAKLGPHLLERNPFSFKNIHSFYSFMYSRVHISSGEVFSKILKKSSIVQKK